MQALPDMQAICTYCAATLGCIGVRPAAIPSCAILEDELAPLWGNMLTQDANLKVLGWSPKDVHLLHHQLGWSPKLVHLLHHCPSAHTTVQIQAEREDDVMMAYLRLCGLREASAERAQDGGNVQAAAVLVLIDDDCRQQQDLAVAPLVVALKHIIRLHSSIFFVCSTCPMTCMPAWMPSLHIFK